MLDFYTDLNNARKEKDDSYAEQNYIGEEIIEPDEVGGAIGNLYDKSFQQKKDVTKPNWEEAEEEDAGNMLGKISEEINEENKE